VTHARRSTAAPDLLRQASSWLRAEAENQELKDRVAAALGDIGEFVARHRSDLERRKGRFVQTAAFKDETRRMEVALANIHRLLTGGRNVSDLFAAIDGFLEAHGADESFAREHTRLQLAAAREHFMGAFHESVRGTKLGDLLDILHFMPYSLWRPRGAEARNFRAPAAAEVLRLLEELRQRGVDVDGLDTVLLAALIRMKLGVTPRMDYHAMSSNKLAEQLTSEETAARIASPGVPLDAALCRSVGGTLAHLRRWAADCLGGASVPLHPEIEAEMLQLACLSSAVLRIGGAGSEHAADYLWLVSTVVGAAHAPLRDALDALAGQTAERPSVRERLAAARGCAGAVAAAADGALLARWAQARAELEALTARTDAIASRSTREFGEFTELEKLKELRSETVKSLIKISDSLRLIEPTLLDPLSSPTAAETRPGGGHLRALAVLRERNLRLAAETGNVARQELAKLRALIERITALSREGLADSATQAAKGRLPGGGRPRRRAADGTDLAGMSDADLHARLRELVAKVALSLRELRGRVEGLRKRTLKSDLQHALLLLGEKAKGAAEACEGSGLDGADAPAVADRVVPLLQEVMAAQARLSTRVGNAKLTPAAKQPLNSLVYTVQTRLGDDLRDLERMRAELAERAGQITHDEPGGADKVDAAPEQEPPAEVGEPQEGPAAAAAPAPEDPREPVPEPVPEEVPQQVIGGAQEQQPEEQGGVLRAVREMAALASAANGALKPVRERVVRVGAAIASRGRDDRAVLAATRALGDDVTGALELVARNLEQLRVTAASRDIPVDEYVEKFDRWTGQLLALGREADLLGRAAESVAALETAGLAARALEGEIADAVKELSVREVGADDLVPLRERCVAALAAIAAHAEQERRTRECLAEAAGGEWRILKSAAGYLESRRPDAGASGPDVQAREARVRRVLGLLDSGRARPGR
jgi:hypothetical protein